MALITIPDKNTGDNLTAAEFNEILDALKDGTLEVNAAGFQVAGAAIDTDDVAEGTNLYFTDERAQDAIGSNMLSGTQTLITVSYDDINNELDFVVDNDLSNYDNSTSGFITATLTEEEVEDFVGGMVTGNTESLISVTYQDVDGTLDFTVEPNLSNYTNDAGFITATLTEEEVQDFAWNVLTGTQTLITVTYDDVNNNVDFIVNNDLSQYDNSTSSFITSTGVTYENLNSNGDVGTGASQVAAGNHTHTHTDITDFDTEVQALSINNVSEDTTPSLGGTLDAADNDVQNIKLAEFQDEHDNGNSGTSATIDWGNGNNQKITLTGNATLSFTAPSGSARLQLKLIQDGTGSRTVTWPAAVRWPGGTAPTLTTTASGVDIVTFYYDGTNYDGVASLDFQ